MWLLHLLPDALLMFIVNLVLFTGVVLTLISTFVFDTIGKYVPMIAPYRTIVRVVSILVLALGVYFKGGYNTEMIWRERVAQLEAQIKVAEEKSKVVNTVIEEKIVYKNRIIEQRAKDIVKLTNQPIVIDFVKNCPIPKEVIDIHNEAVDMNLAIKNKEPK